MKIQNLCLLNVSSGLYIVNTNPGGHIHISKMAYIMIMHILKKANLRDLIAVTGLVILPQSDPNHRFEPVWPWNFTDDLKNSKKLLPCSERLYVSFHSHLWIQIEFVIHQRSNRNQIDGFSTRVPMAFDAWPRKTKGSDVRKFLHGS